MAHETKGTDGRKLPNAAAGGTLASDHKRNIHPQSKRLQELLTGLDRPLEDGGWQKPCKPQAGCDTPKAFLAHEKKRRLHNRALRQARKAAAAAYGIRPRKTVRRQAALALATGAMGLTAFTGPSSAPTTNAVISTEMPETGRRHAARLSASDTFKVALMEEEGVRYTVYRDVAGYPTVGVGHLVRPADNLRVGDRIDDEQVLQFLEDDLRTAEEGVRSLVGDLPLFQHEFDALLDLVYNVGEGNVSENRSPRLNDAVHRGDYYGIAEELQYHHAAGKKAKGLEFRSERRTNIFMDADYEDVRPV